MQPKHLGTFDAARLEADARDDMSLGQAVASLTAITAFIFVLAIVLGALA